MNYSKNIEVPSFWGENDEELQSWSILIQLSNASSFSVQEGGNMSGWMCVGWKTGVRIAKICSQRDRIRCKRLSKAYLMNRKLQWIK